MLFVSMIDAACELSLSSDLGSVFQTSIRQANVRFGSSFGRCNRVSRLIKESLAHSRRLFVYACVCFSEWLLKGSKEVSL